jgi:hypothetical protein
MKGKTKAICRQVLTFTSIAGLGLFQSLLMTAVGRETLQQSQAGRAQVISTTPFDTNAMLRSARVIFVRSRSAFLKASDLENELRKRPEFSQLGLLISKDEQAAELILEVGRKVPGTKFVYSAIDPKSELVVASGSAKAHPLAPGSSSVSHKIAKKFLKQILAARS